jgi:hypothetical protein
MLCSENVTHVRQSHMARSNTIRALMSLYQQSSFASIFTVYTSLNTSPFTPGIYRSAQQMAESIRHDGSSTCDGGCPTKASLLQQFSSPHWAEMFWAQVRVRASSRAICFKVREKSCNPCVSAGGAGALGWERRQFIAPQAGQARE